MPPLQEVAASQRAKVGTMTFLFSSPVPAMALRLG